LVTRPPAADCLAPPALPATPAAGPSRDPAAEAQRRQDQLFARAAMAQGPLQLTLGCGVLHQAFQFAPAHRARPGPNVHGTPEPCQARSPLQPPSGLLARMETLQTSPRPSLNPPPSPLVPCPKTDGLSRALPHGRALTQAPERPAEHSTASPQKGQAWPRPDQRCSAWRRQGASARNDQSPCLGARRTSIQTHLCRAGSPPH